MDGWFALQLPAEIGEIDVGWNTNEGASQAGADDGGAKVLYLKSIAQRSNQDLHGAHQFAGVAKRTKGNGELYISFPVPIPGRIFVQDGGSERRGLH